MIPRRLSLSSHVLIFSSNSALNPFAECCESESLKFGEFDFLFYQTGVGYRVHLFPKVAKRERKNKTLNKLKRENVSGV